MPPPLTNPIHRPKAATQLLFSTIKDLGWRYVGFLLVTSALGLVGLLPPELFRRYVEAIHVGASNWQDLAIFGCAVAVILFIVSYAGTMAQEWLRLTVEANLRRRVLQTMHTLPVSRLESDQRGNWIAHITSDLGSIENFITEHVPNQIREAVTLIGIAVIFAVSIGELALVPLALVAILAALNFRQQVVMAPKLGTLRDLNGSVHQSLIENLEAHKVIKNYGMESISLAKFNEQIMTIRRLGLRVVSTFGQLLATNQLAGQIAVTIVISLAVFAVANRSMPMASALVLPFYIGLFVRAAQSLSANLYHWNRYFAEGGRIAAVFNEAEQFAKSGTQSKDNAAQIYPLERIVLKNLIVGFGRGRPVAGPLSCEINQGTTTVFLGPSGSGKSTTLDVLAGLRAPLSGTVAFGDQTLSAMDLLASCAYVDQHPYLFSGSIRENLTLGNNISDTEIYAAADLVDMSEFLRSRGIDTNIADRGTNVSQGQRYRLALIRAILTRKTVLLLDEPFAALDRSTAEHLAQSLAKLKLRHAIVVVTHYVPTGFHFDQLINFDRPMTTNRAVTVASCEPRENVVPPSNEVSVGPRVEH